ncbi:MAG: 3-deoxy-manno-octulosonate-8-phosphatase KdsC [Immundisolibacteraceae bacterium]|nr:3-deoxy-manno-octulosonate-8-phosphatase KdsC [Immundisolibacteraceae bacterium]
MNNEVTELLLSRAAQIKLLILDVDGVMTDGRLWFGDDGAEYKSFNVKDGHGIKQLINRGIDVAVISGRCSSAVDRRMQELGIEHYYPGQSDKLSAFDELIEKLAVQSIQVAYMGDDQPDVPAMQLCGLPVAVADAHQCAVEVAGWVTRANGGAGAVRELCDLILAQQPELSSDDH